MQTQKVRPAHSRIKGFVRRAAILTLAGVGVVASVPTVAAAGIDTPTAEVTSGDCDAKYHIAAFGYFVADGDRFWLYDDCADGHSAQLMVDVEPFGSSSHYDWKVTVSSGKGGYRKVEVDLHEGTALSVRACVSEGTTTLECGRWETGMS